MKVESGIADEYIFNYPKVMGSNPIRPFNFCPNVRPLSALGKGLLLGIGAPTVHPKKHFQYTETLVANN